MAGTQPQMPDFQSTRRGFHHNLASAIQCLTTLGVDPAQVFIRRSGPNNPDDLLTGQDPEPHSLLRRGQPITLQIGGAGLYHSLPWGVRIAESPGAFGTRALLGIFDDAFAELSYHRDEGPGFFDVAPDNPQSCRAWLTMFGLDPDYWPETMWYNLCVLASNIAVLAGTRRGFQYAFDALLGVELSKIEFIRSYARLEPDDVTRVGDRSSYLGMNFVVGDTMEHHGMLRLTVRLPGVVAYDEFWSPVNQKRLECVLSLLAPFWCHCEVVTTVQGAPAGMSLGDADLNSVLGRNSWLGESEAAGAL